MYQGVEEKSAPLEANTSLFHSQSFTVNTKEAMNVVQEMWHSPSPGKLFEQSVFCVNLMWV